MRSTTRLRNSGLVVLCVAVVFGVGLRGDFVWDDVMLIASNDHLAAPGALRRALTCDFWDTSVPTPSTPGYWRPIPKLSHVLLAMAGRTALPFHALNIALHLVTSLLAMEWLRRRLLDAGSPPEACERGALAGALLFAVHPSRFESVGWVSASTELFFGCFTFAGLLLVDRPRTRLAGLLAFSLAMLSKETALILPLLLAADAALAGRLRARLSVIGGTVLAVCWPMAVRVWLNVPFPSAPDGASLIERIARVLGAWAGYHQRTFVPTEATMIPTEVGAVGAAVFDVPSGWLVAGALLSVAWLGFAGMARRRPRWRPWLSDALWWAFPLAPVLQLIATPNPILISDRFLYLPLLGVIAAFGRLVAVAPAHAARGLRLATGGAALVSGLMVSLALPSFNSSLEFNSREFELHPDNPVAIDNFVLELSRSGNHRAQQVLLERLLARPMSRLRQAKLTVALAESWSHTLRDIDADALRSLSGYFDALSALRPLDALSVGGKRWPMPQEQELARAILSSREAPLYEEATLILRSRTGQADAAIRGAVARRARHPSTSSTLFLAHLLATEERWGDARRVLEEAGPRSPALAAPLAPVVLEGVAMTSHPSLDALDFAIRRARLLGALGAPRRARAVLAPFVETHAASRRLLQARVQAELDDHSFETALEMLERGLGEQPDAAELRAAVESIRALQQEWFRKIEREMRLIEGPIEPSTFVTGDRLGLSVPSPRDR